MFEEDRKLGRRLRPYQPPHAEKGEEGMAQLLCLTRRRRLCFSEIGTRGGAPPFLSVVSLRPPPPPLLLQRLPHPIAERPTDQLPPRPSHRPPREKVGRIGGGERKIPHRARPTFSILPVSSLFDRCQSLSSRQLFPASLFFFFYYCLSLASLSENSGVSLGECFCLFFFVM